MIGFFPTNYFPSYNPINPFFYIFPYYIIFRRMFYKETQFGTIGEGKDSDLVILSDQLSDIPVENWQERVNVETTIANGDVIYQRVGKEGDTLG